MHLANAIRSTLRRWRGNPNDIRPVQLGFANKQVIAVYTAKTDADYESALRKLSMQKSGWSSCFCELLKLLVRGVPFYFL